MATLRTFDGLGLRYEDEGSGHPVVLLHGYTSSVEGNWKRPGIWQVLLDEGFRVIGFDARGHGRSDKPHEVAAYDNSAMVRDVAAVVDSLGLDRFHLVGYSMGAFTALRFAAGSERVRRLVLGGIGGDPDSWSSPEVQAARRERGRRILAGLEAPDPANIEDPLARRVRALMAARGNDLAAMAAIQQAFDFSSAGNPAEVRAATLVVCGDRDADPQPLAAAIPGASSLILEGDHEGVVTNPELAKAIAAFLAG